ncbi:hypothetical protein ACFSQ7_40310 [Paenibacillus rhizoplanae]
MGDLPILALTAKAMKGGPGAVPGSRLLGLYYQAGEQRTTVINDAYLAGQIEQDE